MVRSSKTQIARSQAIIRNLLKKRADVTKDTLDLFDKLASFLDAHGVILTEKSEILSKFVNGEHVDTINKALSWSPSWHGYDFYFFLALRWGKYLVKSADMYPNVYKREKAIEKLDELMKFSDHPHSNVKVVDFDIHIKRYAEFLKKV